MTWQDAAYFFRSVGTIDCEQNVYFFKVFGQPKNQDGLIFLND
jgi:hypothetical protein